MLYLCSGLHVFVADCCGFGVVDCVGGDFCSSKIKSVGFIVQGHGGQLKQLVLFWCSTVDI